MKQQLKSVAFNFTGVCSNCHKLLVDAENKTTVEDEVILQMENVSLVGVNYLL